MLSDASDQELLSAWAGGAAEAGAELVSRHYDSIMRFFQTKAPHHADDLVQHTFLECGEGAPRYQGRGSFRSFLFGIARNLLYDHIRRDLRAGLHTDFDAISVADLHDGVSTQAAKRAESRIVLAALQQIPLESQVLIELYYWEDLSMGELAAAIDVPLGTAKSRLHRARCQFRRALGKARPADDRDNGSLYREWMERLEQAGVMPDS